jgi:glycosyltransferase involved in cell wall biosynthesis
MKITLVGQVSPWKGGVAQHSALLYDELKKTHSVDLISFKRLYPPFLYPGKSDRDTVSDKATEVPADYRLDIINPFTWFSTFNKIRKNKSDFLVLQWAVYQHAFVYIPLLLLVRIFSKTKIVAICHNVLPHKESLMDKFVTKINLSLCHGFLVQSKKDRSDLLKMLPDAKCSLGFNPIFTPIFNTKKYTKIEAKSSLGISSRKVILFFGLVREYKGLIYLIRALPKILKKFEVSLLIAGEFWQDTEKEEIKKLGLGSHIKIVDEYIPNEEVGLYFSAADLLVLPYKSATQTAVAQIGLSFNLPTIVTNVGGLPEIILNNKTGYVVDPCNSDVLAKHIIRFYEEDKSDEFIENIKLDKERFTWSKYVKIMEDLFEHMK